MKSTISSALRQTAVQGWATPVGLVETLLLGVRYEFVGETCPTVHGEARAVPADLDGSTATEVPWHHEGGVIGSPLQHLLT